MSSLPLLPLNVIVASTAGIVPLFATIVSSPFWPLTTTAGLFANDTN